jgi:type VI secretion system protein VasD
LEAQPLNSKLLLTCLASSLLLSGCASKQALHAPAHAELVASSDANPDSAGRPSPVVLRVFQLRNDGEFAGADFFALYDKEKEVLGASLISREEYVLAPGEARKLDLPVSADARFIGVIVAFRDIRAARWRALSRPPEKSLMHPHLIGTGGVSVHVEKDAVTLVVKD